MVSRWWGVALLSLSVGLNLGLAVAVLQQRLAPTAPTVVVVPSPTAPPAVATSPAPELAIAGATPPATAPPVERPAPAVPAQPRSRAATSEVAAEPPEPDFDYGLDTPAPPRPFPGGRDVAQELGVGPRGDGPSRERLEEVAERLGVPVGDRPRFIALQRRFIAETRERRLELDVVRRGLRAELTAPAPDRERLRVLVETSARVQAKLERAFVEHVLAARELLDGEPERRYLEFLSRLGPRAGAPGPRGGAAGPRMGEPRRQRRWGGADGPGRGRRSLEAPRWMPPPAAPSPTPAGPGESPRREGEPPLLQAWASEPS